MNVYLVRKNESAILHAVLSESKAIALVKKTALRIVEMRQVNLKHYPGVIPTLSIRREIGGDGTIYCLVVESKSCNDPAHTRLLDSIWVQEHNLGESILELLGAAADD